MTHVAGPLDANHQQRCARCGLVLKDFRLPGYDMPADEALQARDGGVVYPTGAYVEVRPSWQAMALLGTPDCVPV